MSSYSTCMHVQPAMHSGALLISSECTTAATACTRPPVIGSSLAFLLGPVFHLDNCQGCNLKAGWKQRMP